jgi:hypothetical protein
LTDCEDKLYHKMNISYKILTEIDSSQWDKDLMKSKSSTFFQTTEYLIPPQGADYLAVFVYVLDENGEVVGQLGMRIIRTTVMFASPFFKRLVKIISKVSNRGVWLYGPIIHSSDKNFRIEILRTIIKAVDEILEKYDLVYFEGYTTPTDLLVDEIYNQEFLSNGYVIQNMVTFMADLSKSIEEIWQKVSKKARGDVNRAKRRDITVREVDNYNDLKEYVLLSQQWAKTKGLQITNPLEEIDRLWNNHKEGIEKFFLAYQDGKIISGLRVSCFNGIAITHSVVSAYSQQTSLGGTLLTWSAVEATKTSGLRVYDFTGRTRRNPTTEEQKTQDSLFFYKQKWGGDEFDYYRLTKVRKKFSYKLYGFLFGIARTYHGIKMKKYKKKKDTNSED